MLSTHELSIGDRLKHVTCALQPGKITAICGPNGAGKSTLLEAMAGLLDPDVGSVELDGSGLFDLPPRRLAKRIGYLPQSAEVAWDVSVRTLVQLGRMPHGDQLAEPVDAALAALDLAPLADRRAQSLSGGETARVLLARVLAGEPDWILADEPLAALDLGHQLDLLRHLRRAADAGAGVVLVLHDLAHAMNHADRVLVLDRGALVADDRPESALDDVTILDVWGVAASWVGESGKRALVTA
ncbi:ABC transporter ATP-binding protein [Qipengyuania gelatinilytica]|uniref:ABC transporter ATP-binding protein n=1 Tax=Qipengyuania gelatinilytica TaxID=2867231 RepID=A0ABX9A2W4_9SPHN|nr:ABC transporter ATP-binding protein [Qipengyuania gelatinilytica]QZD95606.1 ABC transporter ATP-binding protein [Qipengyuania gelatinilytica]